MGWQYYIILYDLQYHNPFGNAYLPCGNYSSYELLKYIHKHQFIASSFPYFLVLVCLTKHNKFPLLNTINFNQSAIHSLTK